MFVEAMLVRKSPNSMDIVIIIRRKSIKNMSVDQKITIHQLPLDLKDTTMIIKSMHIEIKNVDQRQNLTRHLRRKEMHLSKVTYIVWITIYGTIVIYVVNMVIL